MACVRNHPAGKGGETTATRVKTANARDPNAASPITFDEFAALSPSIHARQGARDPGVPKENPSCWPNLCRPEDQGRFLLDHGLQPAHRGTWVNNMIYNVHLLVGKIRTGAAVLAYRSAFRLRYGARGGTFATACRPTWS